MGVLPCVDMCYTEKATKARHRQERQERQKQRHNVYGIILPFARGCRVGVGFGFVRAALLPAVGTCVVLSFGVMPGWCCFLRVNNVLHGESSKRMATPRNTKDKITYVSTMC